MTQMYAAAAVAASLAVINHHSGSEYKPHINPLNGRCRIDAKTSCQRRSFVRSTLITAHMRAT